VASDITCVDHANSRCATKEKMLNLTLIALQTIVKLNLIAPVLDVLFPIICDLSCEDEEDTEAVDVDAQTPSSCAVQVAVQFYWFSVLSVQCEFLLPISNGAGLT